MLRCRLVAGPAVLLFPGDVERLEGRPAAELLPEAVVERKPFINLRSFCRFFFPPGPEAGGVSAFLGLEISFPT